MACTPPQDDMQDRPAPGSTAEALQALGQTETPPTQQRVRGGGHPWPAAAGARASNRRARGKIRPAARHRAAPVAPLPLDHPSFIPPFSKSR
jgi:hypothetical protein